MLMSVALRTDGAITPLAVANAKGFFRTEGVSVTLDHATNSVEALRRVASGERDMALVDMTALIRYREQADTAPIKAVFVFHSQTPYAIVARKSRGITNFASLEGQSSASPKANPSRCSGRPLPSSKAWIRQRSRSRKSASRYANRCCRQDNSTPSPDFRSLQQSI